MLDVILVVLVLVVVVLGLKSAHASPPAPPLACTVHMYLFILKIGLRCERKKERNTYVGNSETF